MISAGRLRRLAHPILLRYWMKHSTNRTLHTSVGGFRLRVLPTVFHPRYFGSSAILGKFVESFNVQGKTFLDMGTGSGVVALHAARSGAVVTGVDINPNAIRCASENAAAAGLAIELRQSDLFAAIPQRRFDVIAWNPPFFPKPAQDSAEQALHAGDGYVTITRFAREARNHLNSAGRILLVLSADLDLSGLESMFRREGFSVKHAASRKWGFGETMVVLEIQ